MPNVIKYSTTIQPNTIKKGNLLLGVNNIGYGPSNVTGYWAGINPPTSGYTIYRVATETSGYTINTCETDNDVIYWASVYGNTGGDNINQALRYLTTGNSNTTIVNKNYESIVTSGLVLNLDATFVPSYPKSGTLWYDISGNVNNGTLTNGPSYSSLSGGSIVFDGIDDTTTFLGGTFGYSPGVSGSVSLEIWVYPTGPFTSYVAEPPTTNLGGFLGQGYFNSSIGWGLGMYSTSTSRYFSFQVRNLGTIVQSTSENLAFNLNTWYHVVGSFNRSDFSRVYVNGNLMTSASTNSLSALTITPNFNDARIGSTPSFFSGCRIPVARIYNRALSAQEVQQNYEASGRNYVSFDVQYLVVAGGGGGNNNRSGGGGAGGLLSGVTSSVSLNTNYVVTVGAGGSFNTNGSNSTFSTTVSIGGGRSGVLNGDGFSGGSGGGSGHFWTGIVAQSRIGGSGVSGQGFSGGTAFSGTAELGPGGGGASQSGGNSNSVPFGFGGSGLYFSEYVSLGGSPAGWFAGGGGGGNSYASTKALGGNGGGGNGSIVGLASTNGVINTGGGGGGNGVLGGGAASGGSGIIILRIPVVFSANFSSGVSYTLTKIGGYSYYRVTATSTTSETVTFS